jgi:nitrile hydratase accessory protein
MKQSTTLKDMLDTAAQDIAPFESPWQAQSFACIMELSKQGHFTWNDWVQTFSREINTHPQREGETANEAYYRQWMGALESIILSRNLCTAEEIAAREEDWRRAYANTPHGQPIELSAAYSARCSPTHHHSELGKPIAISPPTA